MRDLIFGFTLITFDLSFILSWETTNHSKDCELVLVQVVFRHGDRNPIDDIPNQYPIPNDPYRKESFWPGGYGQLTKLGKQQQFELGQYLRKRYDGYLSPVYSPYEIYVQSSDVDRTIMSANANLAGLYPPNNDTVSRWNPDLNWQPIPVHTLPKSIDNIIGQTAPCPRYKELFHDFEANSDMMQKVYEDHKELFQLLTKYTGQKVSTVEGVDDILDILHIEKIQNKAWAPWATEVMSKYGNQTERLAALYYKVLTYTLEMQRLMGGPLVNEIVENMKGKMNQSLDARRKFFMYSGHDRTVSSLLNTLDMFNDIIAPPYCSMVMVELHRNITSNVYFVEVMYRNSTAHDPYKMQIPGCDFSCDLTKFLELTASRIPLNWDRECQSMRTGPKPGEYDAVGVLVSTMLLFILVGLCIAMGLILKAYLRKKRTSEPQAPQYPYLHLQTEEGDEERLGSNEDL